MTMPEQQFEELADLPEDHVVDEENLETAESNDDDVTEALKKDDTEDGKGGAVVPRADFVSFSEGDVENDTTDDELDSV
jgi:hypothetical protein